MLTTGLRLSLQPSNGWEVYCLGWRDIHKETLCQQAGKHISLLVLVRLLETSFKSNRTSGTPLRSPWYAVRHDLVGECRAATGSLMAANYIGFLQAEPHGHLCMSFSMTQFRDARPLQEALRDHRLCLALPAVGFHTMTPTGWRIAAQCQERLLFAFIGFDTCMQEEKK